MAHPDVTLTEEQLREQTAVRLLDMLENISADGVLTDDEIVWLDSWLESAEKTELPALAYLRGIVRDVLADRVIIADERRAIVAAILRVMPPDKRSLARVRFAEAGKRGSTEESEWKADDNRPASPEQVKFIQAMGMKVAGECTSAKASEIIEGELSTSKPVSARQRMILRFWNRQDLASEGRASVDEWLDGFYAENPDRLAAWELWKSENGDCGRDDSPDRVDEGAGEIYMGRIRDTKSAPPDRPLAYRIAMGVIAVILFAIVACMIHKYGHPAR